MKTRSVENYSEDKSQNWANQIAGNFNAYLLSLCLTVFYDIVWLRTLIIIRSKAIWMQRCKY